MLEKDSDGESDEEEEERSESGSTTEEEDVDIIYEEGEPEIQEENIPMIEKETCRLAVVNMDWRHVKAADLYVMLNSFLPKDGQIMSVAVYPSEFGLTVHLQTMRVSVSIPKHYSKVKSIHLTWDEDEPQCGKILKRKFNAEQSGDGSDEDGEDNDQDMEVTFNTGLEDISKRILEKKNKEAETGADTGVKGYNLKPKKAKGKKGKEVIDEEKIPTVDEDRRFSAFFTSPLYALDPTDPQFKRSATYARQMAKKLQKSEQQELAVENSKITNSQFPSNDHGVNKVEKDKSDILPSKEKHELSSMVRSVKMKLKQVQLPSASKMPKKKSKVLRK
ncbi:pre-rRNA-processing protein ESF1 [Corchorus olitorius]|uniref:Pre-rRNA-processing protein ESF1 n=1 Tax=Corchorus olitorius TaxID=93759 RepID=A0A1R3GNA7_9ROSI|nr:pre-rRNA-processing protein ESF1 [Corchorus olitorius]